MTPVHELQALTERVLLDPKYHAPLTLLKAIRNGAVYGTKIRFPHALVMVFLFRSGTIRQKLSMIFKATRQHAQNLATFAFIYKALCLALRSAQGGKERQSDSFIAGLVGGYYVFGRKKSSVNQQIVIYVAARVALAMTYLALRPGRGDNALVGSRYGAGRGGLGWLQLSEETRTTIRRAAWPTFAGVSWASVMWLFRYYPDALQPSLKSSMIYIYDDAEKWDSFRNFLIHNR